MKSGHNVLVLMILGSVLVLIPKRLRRRMRSRTVPTSTPQLRKGKGGGTREVWTDDDEAEWSKSHNK